jgi:transposase InsO family protein
MGEALEVSESGYYARANRSPSRAEQRRSELVAAIAVIHAEVKGRYGSPRMTAELNARGYQCSENTVANLMKTHGIRAKAPRRFVRTTDARHTLPVAANVLDRDFDPPGPDIACSAEITYIPTADGWLYLAVVEDLFSRLVVDALDRAIRRRLSGAGLIAHSDRGQPVRQRALAAPARTAGDHL